MAKLQPLPTVPALEDTALPEELCQAAELAAWAAASAAQVAPKVAMRALEAFAARCVGGGSIWGEPQNGWFNHWLILVYDGLVNMIE